MRAIITGAAAGIGRAIAERLAADGSIQGEAKLTIVDRDPAGLESVGSTLRSYGADVCVVQADLADVTTPARVIECAQRTFGGLDLLVSNAGIMVPGSLLEISLEDYERVFAVNTRATWLLAREAYPMLKESQGSLVAISSLASVVMTPLRGVYSASKAAVVMLTQQFAYEWGADGIRSNSISPGAIETPLNASTFPDPQQAAARISRIPLRRMGLPEDIASTVAFLAGPDGSYMTGQNLVVDGGMTAGMMAAFREPPRERSR